MALTRTFVWDPAVLILDEATAAVDSASDEAFCTALRTLMAHSMGSPVLTVAHHLATAGEANRVVVLDEGRVVEAGTP